MKTCKEISAEWNIATRTVTALCKSGKIPGAIKSGKSWLIPEDAVRPKDNRISSGKYKKQNECKVLKALPIGISDYVRTVSEYYYVDKTLMIKEFLDQRPLVSLFTRPRRFGKTLNMDMLRVFFEISENDTSVYFKDTNIWKCGEKYCSYQGKYPVIFLTFKDVKFGSWAATLAKIQELLQDEFSRHCRILESKRIAKHDKDYFSRILDGTATEVELSSALKKLSQMLKQYYDVAPVIIIDEYDTPIQEGYSENFYEEIIGFMRNFFSGAFKDNQNLTFGFLTGILRISQESIFSGLNNLSVNSITDKEYDKYFGFTQQEVREMLNYYGVSDKAAELKEWYDGYLFGNEEIYNPWSVINYIARSCVPQAYWVNTGKNEILKNILADTADEIREQLELLLRGKCITARINQNVIYRDLAGDPANIYSLLLVAGYLKIARKELLPDGSYLCEMSIPNKEISTVYKSEILSHLIGVGFMTRSTADQIMLSLYKKDFKKLQQSITEYMIKSISFFDGGAEGFYHGLVLGLIAMMDNQYHIQSNRESGNGRYDISMFPKTEKYPGIIMELKWKHGLDSDELENLAKEALNQIDEKNYDVEMVEYGVSDVIKVGIAFSGKQASIQMRQG